MTSEARRRPVRRPHDAGLRVLVARLPAPGERPIPTEEEAAAFHGVDPSRDRRIRCHLEPQLGFARTTMHETYGAAVPIDVGVTEPDATRPWGACVTIGASAPGTPVAPLRRRRASSSSVELYLRLPPEAYVLEDGTMMEPFEAPWDAVIDALGELGRLPRERNVRYRAPQIVATPGLQPIVPGLPFGGVWLRDGAARDPAVRGFREAHLGTVRFLSVTFLHPSEVQALTGPDRLRASAKIEAAGVDELLRPARPPVL